MPRIVQLLASPVHRYVGRPADGPAPAPSGELVEEVRIRAGLGIVGDRYFGKQAHRNASVTVIAQESLPPGVDLVQVRRNVLTAGIAVFGSAWGEEAEFVALRVCEDGPRDIVLA
ncbi:hypothetical protein SAMN04489832_0274 [Micromonospora cremea]|uniref:MOSC domain-containing protein n=1 Tax=Micromonospora cremea TaxID=709881 RepID=A0A1N5TMT8_9ACTN|nr:hypothetical protein SAMN04489832_0274 [Micromonospora cremea]